MTFTKQDIKRLVNQLVSVSAKDSGFPVVKKLDDDTHASVTIVHENKNKLMTVATLTDYISKNFRTELLPVSIPNDKITSHNLKDLLEELCRLATANSGGGGGGKITADSLSYANSDLTLEEGNRNVKGALDALVVLVNQILNDEDEDIPIVNYIISDMLASDISDMGSYINSMPLSVYFHNTSTVSQKYRGKIVRFDKISDTEWTETISDPDPCAIYFYNDALYKYNGTWTKVVTGTEPPPSTRPGFTVLIQDQAVIISAVPGNSSFIVTEDEIVIQQ